MIGKHTLVVALGHWLWNNQWVCGAIFVPARKLSTATYGGSADVHTSVAPLL